jgi:hypothetical protein
MGHQPGCGNMIGTEHSDRIEIALSQGMVEVSRVGTGPLFAS